MRPSLSDLKQHYLNNEYHVIWNTIHVTQVVNLCVCVYLIVCVCLCVWCVKFLSYFTNAHISYLKSLDHFM